MCATHVSYEAAGWGVGEVWLEGGPAAAPRAPAVRPSSSAGRGNMLLGERFVRYFAGRGRRLPRCASSSSTGATEFELALTAALRRVRSRRGRDVRRAGRARRASERPACCGNVLRAQPVLDRRSVPPGRVGRTGSARTARSASSTSGGCWSSKVSLSEDLAQRAGRDQRRSGTATGSPSSRGSRTRPGACTCAGAGRSRLHLDLASPAAARPRLQPPPRARRDVGDPDVPAARVRRGRRATSSMSRGRAGRCEVSSEAGVVGARRAPLERPPKRVVARACCRARTCAARCSAAGRCRGRGRRIWRCGPRPSRARSSSPRSRSAPARELRVLDKGRHAVAYAKGSAPIADALAAAGASDAVLVLEEQVVMGATKARANRLANADHANLVRTSRAAQEQIRAVKRLERGGGLGRCRRSCGRSPGCAFAIPSLSLRELALRCSPPATKSAAQRRLASLVRLAGL